MITAETYSDFPPILHRAVTLEDLESVFASNVWLIPALAPLDMMF